MIRLFDRPRQILFLGAAVTVAVTVMMIAAGERAFAIFVAITGMWVSWYACLSGAIRRHNRLLSILYDDLEPVRFMEEYRPLLGKAAGGSAMEAAMRAHLGNALAARGMYEEALSWYESGCKKSDVALMQHENRCRCLFELGRTNALQEEMTRWKALLPQVKKARRETSLHSMELLEIRRRVRQGRTSGEDQLFVQREQQGTNKRLHRCEMSLLLAGIYGLLGYETAMRQELETLAALNNEELACCRGAKERLAELGK